MNSVYSIQYNLGFHVKRIFLAARIRGRWRPHPIDVPIDPPSQRRAALPWIVLATIAVAAILAWLTLTRGAGVPARSASSEHHALVPFHELEIGGAADVVLVQGGAEAIDVDDTDGASVHAEVIKGRLVVRSHDRRRFWGRLFGHDTRHAPTITIHVRNLDRLSLTGTVKVTVPKLQASTLLIGASGGANLTIDDLTATTLRVEGSGALSAELGGRVDDQYVSISGAGSYNAERLQTATATVSVSGVGNVIVNAQRKLRASISGAGVIEYIGDPQVTENVSGMGRVRRHDSSTPKFRVAMLSYCSREGDGASVSLNSSGAPVIESMSAWTPARTRTSLTRQSRSSPVSIAATSCTDSYA